MGMFNIDPGWLENGSDRYRNLLIGLLSPDAYKNSYDRARSGMSDAMSYYADNPWEQIKRDFNSGILSMPTGKSVSEEEMSNLLNAISPMGLLGTFAGVGAKTANKALLDAAKKLDASGVDRTKIWNETGWFRGPDKKWRFEIDDSGAIPGHKTYSWGDRADAEAGNNLTVRRQKALLHPKLSAAYPDTKGIGFTLKRGMSGGSYAPEFDNVIAGYASNGAADKSIALHELQHAIQQREGFAMGGSPQMAFLPQNKEAFDILKRIRKDMATPMSIDDYAKNAWQTDVVTQEIKNAYSEYAKGIKKTAGQFDRQAQETAAKEYYKRLAGEAEARAVQTRMDFDAAKRKAIPPWESYDIPWDQLIVR